MRRRFTIQTWLVWGAGASAVVLAGRNPYPIMLVICVVAATHLSWCDESMHQLAWRSVMRLALILASFSVGFNILTARSGDRILLAVPDSVPILGGPFTWNAVAFGIVSALIILGLLLIWSLVAAHISWDQLARIVPDRMIGFAVAGATAVNLIPQTMRTVSSIREACTGRGMRSTRGRDLAFLMTPILTSGLDRSMQLAEVLEARGFGATTVETGQHRSRSAIGWVVMLSGLTVLAYAVLARIEWGIGIGLILSVGGFAAVFSFRQTHAIGRTRYRVHPLRPLDWLVIACAVSAPITAAMLGAWRPELFTWSPYPALGWPTFSVGIVLPSLMLMIPMVVAELGNPRD